MSKLITKARSGVTLVELLVVILIVTILSVSLLPLLKPYIVKAQYAAEPIPVIGNLRTQIGLFQYDKNYLPGLPKTPEGEVVCKGDYISADIKEEATLSGKGGESIIVSGLSPIQTFCSVAIKESEDATVGLSTYRRAVFDDGKISGDTAYKLSLTEKKAGTEKPADGVSALINSDTDIETYPYTVNHFGKELGINYEDLTGKRMKPVHVQYRVLYGGYKSGTYAYAIGVFGDANGLAAGTGYAVLEIVNPDAGVKYVGTWERYKTVSGNAGQIKMATASESDVAEGETAATANVCWLGNPQFYLKGLEGADATSADIASTVANAITELTKAGWEFK